MSKHRSKLTEDEILNIVIAELENAPANNNLETPLDYYLGAPNGQEVDGRSALTSLDVADSIEWIMPQIMKSFTQTNEIVTFDPVNEDDELQAELESEYVYSILMKKNPGFITIHQFVKDALMQRNGLIKIYFDKSEMKTTESYTGLTQAQFVELVASDAVEITSMSENVIPDPMGNFQTFFDASIVITHTQSRINVESVPPEDFRVNSQHNSIDLSTARFTAHVQQKTVSQLIEDGYSQDIIDNLSSEDNNNSEYRFQAQGENASSSDGYTWNNPAMRLITIIEAYTYMDINGDGIAEMVKVCCAGVDIPSQILSYDEIDSQPWISTTAILMSHKFQGLSIYDRLKEIQDHKTALIRNIQDNIYQQNNQRTKVLMGQVNLDDLLVSRSGGVVRVKNMGAMEPIITPQLSPAAFEMMRYLDEVRAGRSGVSSEGSATPQNVGNRVGSEGVDRLMTAKEELVGLIIRVISETGIKPMMLKIRDLAHKHLNVSEDFKFRGRWEKVNPSQWRSRSDSTVWVGTGSGDTRAKLAAISKVMDIQTAALQQPGQVLVNQNNIYSAIDDFCKFAGLNGATKYFNDPTTAEGQQAQQQAQAQQAQQQQKLDAQSQAMVQMQMQLASAETMKAQAAQQNVALKGQAELAKHQREMDKLTMGAQLEQAKSQLAAMQTLLDQRSKNEQMEFDYDQLAIQTAMDLTELEANTKAQQDAEFQQNVQTVSKDE